MLFGIAQFYSVHGMVVVVHNFGNEGWHFFMYTLPGCSIDSCTDTSVILHPLSWNFEIAPFRFNNYLREYIK